MKINQAPPPTHTKAFLINRIKLQWLYGSGAFEVLKAVGRVELLSSGLGIQLGKTWSKNNLDMLFRLARKKSRCNGNILDKQWLKL